MTFTSKNNKFSSNRKKKQCDDISICTKYRKVNTQMRLLSNTKKIFPEGKSKYLIDGKKFSLDCEIVATNFFS